MKEETAEVTAFPLFAIERVENDYGLKVKTPRMPKDGETPRAERVRVPVERAKRTRSGRKSR